MAEDRRLLEPGWAGELAEGELAYIQRELLRDKALAYRWGFAPSAKTRPEAAIRRVAMWGDPDARSVNVALARPRKDTGRDNGGAEVSVGRPKTHPTSPGVYPSSTGPKLLARRLP